MDADGMRAAGKRRTVGEWLVSFAEPSDPKHDLAVLDGVLVDQGAIRVRGRA